MQGNSVIPDFCHVLYPIGVVHHVVGIVRNGGFPCRRNWAPFPGMRAFENGHGRDGVTRFISTEKLQVVAWQYCLQTSQPAPVSQASKNFLAASRLTLISISVCCCFVRHQIPNTIIQVNSCHGISFHRVYVSAIRHHRPEQTIYE